MSSTWEVGILHVSSRASSHKRVRAKFDGFKASDTKAQEMRMQGLSSLTKAPISGLFSDSLMSHLINLETVTLYML